MRFAEFVSRPYCQPGVSLIELSMTPADSPVVAYQFAVIQAARGQPGIGLTLHLLLQGASGESTAFLQLEPASVFAVRDACVNLAAQHQDEFQHFLAKKRASHQLNYGDKFLKTLPANDPYGLFHRRQQELVMPVTFRTMLQKENTGTLVESVQTSGGLTLRFSLTSSADFVCRLPHDLAFLLVDSIDQAIWAAEWERGGAADAGSR